MKIVQINAIYGTLSTGTIVKDIHELCRKVGIESYVVSPIISQSYESPEVYKIGNMLDEKYHAIMSRVTGKQAYFSKFSTHRLLNYLDKIQPDIIHLHNLHNNFINLPMFMRYVENKRIKVVVTLHDCWFYTGGCTHYTHIKCNRWKDGCGSCKDVHIKLIDSSKKVLSDRIRYFHNNKNVSVVGVSDWIRRESLVNVFHGCSSYTVYNGIDTDIFRYRQSDLRKRLELENQIIILGPATKWLDPERKDYLKEFTSNLKSNETLLIFGCKDLTVDVPKGVKLYGFIHGREELAELYSMADVFANCSYEESMSLINVECQACGTPVALFDNTGMSETVDGITGLRVPTGDYRGLLDACRILYTNNNQKVTQKRLDFIHNTFEKNTNYGKLIEIYQDVYNHHSS